MAQNLTLAQVQALVDAADQMIALTGYSVCKTWAPNMPSAVQDARIELLRASYLCKLRIETILKKHVVEADTPV
jgi:hypothetical protein